MDRPIGDELLGKHLEACELEGDEAKVTKHLEACEVSDVMVRGVWPLTQGPARIFGMAGHAWGWEPTRKESA